jgi:hypothetical protein
MKNLLALIGALIVGFAVVGWYMGWYKLGVTKSTDGNLHVETNVNTNKVVEDSSDALKRAGQFIDNHAAQGDKNAAPTAGATPGPQSEQKVSIFGLDLTPKK